MNATETNLLIRADRMSESTLVGLQDWELAYLRVAMLHQLEETLNESLDDVCIDTPSPRREAGVQPCPSGQGYGSDGVVIPDNGSAQQRVEDVQEYPR